MYPLAHFAVAALPYLLYTLIRHHRLPRGHALLLVLVATQLPDVIDKPLAWTFGVIPSGRMLAHSLVIAIPVLTAVSVIAISRGFGRSAVLFGVSYLSHIAADSYSIFWQGTNYYFFPNLFWPLLPANPDMNPSFAAHAPPSLSAVLLPLGIFFIICAYIVLDLVIHPPRFIH